MGWQSDPAVDPNAAAAPAAPAWQGDPSAPAAAPSAPANPNAPGLFDPNQMARNLTFGLSDKAAALGAATGAVLPGSAHPGSFWDRYSSRLNELRQGGQEYASAHPVASLVGPLAGGLIAAPARAAGAALSLPRAMGQSAIGGGAIGAAQGFGAADESPLRDTLAGAAGGAAIGAVIPPAMQLMRPMVEGFQRLMPSFFPQAVERQAAARIGERVGQDVVAGGPGVPEMQTTLSQTPGKPQGLVDVGGENLRGLAGSVARTPGTSREIANNFFTNRDVGAGTRLIGDIDASISNGSNAHDAVQTLMQQRAAAAAPLYDKAFSYPVNISPKLQGFLGDPLIQEGLVKGREIQRLEGLAGNPVPSPQSIWSQLDAAKRGLDDIIERYRDPTTGRLALDQRGRAINQVRASYLSELDKVNPDYAAARQAWSGPSAAMDALNRGQNFHTMRPEEIRDQIAGMPHNDRQFFLNGVADRLRTDVLKTAVNGDEAKRLVNSQYVQDQLRPLFQHQADYDQFINSVTAERRMFQTRGAVVGNSATAARMAEDLGHNAGPVANLAAGIGAIAAHEPFAGLPLLMRGARAAYDALGRPNPALREALAKALFNPDQAANAAFLARLANQPPPIPTGPLLMAPGAKAAGTLLPGWLSGGSAQ